MLNERDDFKEQLNKCSEQLLMQDGIALGSYVLSSTENGVIIQSLVPFIALYCRSAQEYFGERIIEDETDKQVNDIRNGLKLYSDRYSKAKSVVLDLDHEQNTVFKNMLRFDFMKNWNIHYNLGVYFDSEGHIVGDTQHLSYFLNLPNMDYSEQSRRAFEIGRLLGNKFATFLRVKYNIEIQKVRINLPNYPHIGYRDFNTNRKSMFFVKNSNKELSLIFLHILSSIGFVEYILKAVSIEGDLWLFRIEYITAHYAWSALKKINNYHTSNYSKEYELIDPAESIINEGTSLFSSLFRNCMMHYDLYYQGQSAIKPEYFDVEKPFFGLVESCFDNKSFDDFASDLRIYIHKLETFLLSWFNVDIKKIKWD